jgi:hypothetical protein
VHFEVDYRLANDTAPAGNETIIHFIFRRPGISKIEMPIYFKNSAYKIVIIHDGIKVDRAIYFDSIEAFQYPDSLNLHEQHARRHIYTGASIHRR